jgi:hypothetical protein
VGPNHSISHKAEGLKNIGLPRRVSPIDPSNPQEIQPKSVDVDEILTAVLERRHHGQLLLLVLLGWIVGTFAGAWITALRADRAPIGHGLVLGGLFLVAAIVNMLMIPNPVWFWILGVAIFLPSAFLGAKLGARSRPVPSPALE